MNALASRSLSRQRGGFALGLIVGLLIGLALALGVALYIAKVPVPFVDKVGHRSAEQDAAEAEKLKTWDPNAGLAGKQAPRPTMPASGASAPAAAAPVVAAPASAATAAAKPASRPDTAAEPAKSSRDPAAILAGQSPAPAAAATPSPGSVKDGSIYFVQAGAFSSADDAEQQRAKLAMQGFAAKVSEREQSGRTVHRVRIGPFETKDDARAQQERLKSAGAESALVAVDRPKP